MQVALGLKVVALVPEVIPVSYTHLDVYKRQEDDSGPFPDPVRPFEGGDRVVAILLLASAFGHWTSLTFQYLYGIILVYPISGSCVKEGDAI